MTSVALPAYAKVNLHLEVVGRRPDGYHELVTLFERIDLADELTIALVPGSGVEFLCGHPEVPSDGTNLVVRAAEAYRKASGWSPGLRMALKKKIPVAAGLGGGSSDAAAALTGLQILSGRLLTPEALLACAKGLGADVPFFLAQTPFGIGRGRGDEVAPLDLPTHLWHLVVFPCVPVSTKSVYQALDSSAGSGSPAAQARSDAQTGSLVQGRFAVKREGDSLTPERRDVTFLVDALRDGNVMKVRDLLFNALEPTVEALYPAIHHLKETIRSQGGLKRPFVSGSGSSVVALCGSREEAFNALQALKRGEPRWQVFVARTQG